MKCVAHPSSSSGGPSSTRTTTRPRHRFNCAENWFLINFRQNSSRLILFGIATLRVASTWDCCLEGASKQECPKRLRRQNYALIFSCRGGPWPPSKQGLGHGLGPFQLSESIGTGHEAIHQNLNSTSTHARGNFMGTWHYAGCGSTDQTEINQNPDKIVTPCKMIFRYRLSGKAHTGRGRNKNDQYMYNKILNILHTSSLAHSLSDSSARIDSAQINSELHLSLQANETQILRDCHIPLSFSLSPSTSLQHSSNLTSKLTHLPRCVS